MHRVFFGLDLSSKQKQQINQWRVNALTTSFQPVDLNNYHITLLFIGNVTQSQIKQLIRIGDLIEEKSFSVNLTNLDFWAKPKVLFLKPQSIPQALDSLFTQLLTTITTHQSLLALQQKPMVHIPYQPHVTLSRKAKYLPKIINASIKTQHPDAQLNSEHSVNSTHSVNRNKDNKHSQENCQKTTPEFQLCFNHFCLFESISTPLGVKYKVLQSWPLR